MRKALEFEDLFRKSDSVLSNEPGGPSEDSDADEVAEEEVDDVDREYESEDEEDF